MEPLIWVGIVFCITQSSILSGLNLAYFSLSKLRLQIEASQGNQHAASVLLQREDYNFLLTTILLGNVSVNVLLTILSDSVMTGLAAFIFSTITITYLGEIIPQAYFSRHALKMSALFTPVLRIYQFILYPVIKPTSLFLDKVLKKEAVQFFDENDLEELIRMHMKSAETDIDHVEGKGALNFLAIDDIPLSEEGEIIDPKSLLPLSFKDGRPIFPLIDKIPTDPFLCQIQASEKKWVVLIDPQGEPKIVVNADTFLREAFFKSDSFNPYLYCHRPIVVKNEKTTLGKIIPQLKVHPERSDDDVIDQDIILLWGAEKRVITGADILGRLLRGIVQLKKTAEKM
ncbi:MAG: DUF21 domain-containing protein [Nitrospiria bacterium]